jgi:hypothetical protein
MPFSSMMMPTLRIFCTWSTFLNTVHILLNTNSKTMINVRIEFADPFYRFSDSGLFIGLKRYVCIWMETLLS